MSNKNILETINFLLNNNEDVYWSNSNYHVKKDSKTNKLIVVCIENGYTTPLEKEDIKDCGTHKWAIREYDLYDFKFIPHQTTINY
jgi:hypothetical protein|tara:strand:- start:649 stop:906 length:258 start_codon:yes stop_codon:yes gene_type:complete